jgi:hypothetical protein
MRHWLAMDELTEEQKKVILQLGDTESDVEMVPVRVLNELIALCLVYKRSDGRLDLTDRGEELLDSLRGEAARRPAAALGGRRPHRTMKSPPGPPSRRQRAMHPIDFML